TRFLPQLVASRDGRLSGPRRRGRGAGDGRSAPAAPGRRLRWRVAASPPGHAGNGGVAMGNRCGKAGKSGRPGAQVIGPTAMGPRALGPTAAAPLALAACAVGAVAVGAMAIGRLAVAKAVVRELEAGEV